MNNKNSIDMLLKLVNLVYILSTLNIPTTKQVSQLKGEIDNILQIDQQAELQQLLDVIVADKELKRGNCSLKERERAIETIAKFSEGYRLKKQQAEPRVDPDEDILNFYENQMH